MRAVLILLVSLLVLGLSVDSAFASSKDDEAAKAAKAAKIAADNAAFGVYTESVRNQLTKALEEASLPTPTQVIVDFSVYKTGRISDPRFKKKPKVKAATETIKRVIKENRYPEMEFDAAYVNFKMAVDQLKTASGSRLHVNFLEAEKRRDSPAWRLPQGIMRMLVPFAAFFILAVQTFMIIVSAIWIVKQRRSQG
jgi:hypothetical protein